MYQETADAIDGLREDVEEKYRVLSQGQTNSHFPDNGRTVSAVLVVEQQKVEATRAMQGWFGETRTASMRHSTVLDGGRSFLELCLQLGFDLLKFHMHAVMIRRCTINLHHGCF
jgi:hypothetical protein